MAAFLFSCNQKNVEEKEKSSLLQSIKPKMEVRLVGEVLTRKSYASIQFMEDQKEIDSYLEKQYASHPTVAYLSDSIGKFLISQFERLGLIKNGELLLQNFKKQTDEKTTYTDSSGREVNLLFYQLTGHCHFKLLLATDSVDIDTGGTNLQDLDYAFLDIIPGGNKELVFLDDYHIMNGDNFDFKIYEIKIR
jgi:hypothetical protein